MVFGAIECPPLVCIWLSQKRTCQTQLVEVLIAFGWAANCIEIRGNDVDRGQGNSLKFESRRSVLTTPHKKFSISHLTCLEIRPIVVEKKKHDFWMFKPWMTEDFSFFFFFLRGKFLQFMGFITFNSSFSLQTYRTGETLPKITRFWYPRKNISFLSFKSSPFFMFILVCLVPRSAQATDGETPILGNLSC